MLKRIHAKAIYYFSCCLTIVFLSQSIVALAVEKTPQVVKIGVLAKRGKAICLEHWNPTAEYLSTSIPKYHFKITPLSFNEVYPAVAKGQVEFIFVNSSLYIYLEAKYHASRIATLINESRIGPISRFGGAIFCRKGRKDISSLVDLNGETFAAVDATSFGGWQVAWREFKEHGINPERDFSALKFLGTHDRVVYAVKSGKVDAGTVRTDILERMEREGKIKLSDFKILHPIKTGYFPYVHSTRLYPEWPFARLLHTPEPLARRVAVTLLKMKATDKAAIAAQCGGWTIPANYQPVRECLKSLQLAPYDLHMPPKFGIILRIYWKEIIGILFVGWLLVLLVLYSCRLRKENQHLLLTHQLSSQRDTAQFELTKIQKLFNGVTKHFLDAVVILNEEGIISFCNPEAERLFDCSELRVIGSRLRDLVEPIEDSETFTVEINGLLNDELTRSQTSLREFRNLCDPNDKSILEGSLSRIRDAGGFRVMGAFRDITERKRIEHALRASEGRLLTLINSTPDCVYLKDGEGRWEVTNEAGLKLFQLQNVDYRGKSEEELASFSPFYSDTLLYCRESDEDAWAKGSTSRGEEVIPLPGGGEKVFDVIKSPVFFENGERRGLVVVAREITVQKSLERELIRSRDFLQKVIDSIPNEIIVIDPDYTVTMSNKAAKDTWTVDPKAPGLKCYEVSHGNDTPCDSDDHPCPLRKALSLNGAVSLFHLHVGPNGENRHVALSATPVRDESGEIMFFVESSLDITERVLLEAQLRHSQKMEAVGQLAGGIAHDFNNLLQVIMGASEMLAFEIADGSPLENYVQEISEAAKRAAELTRKLLLFGRKQHLKTEYVDLNRVTQELLKLLRRVIGENIEISFSPCKDSAIAFADKGQVEQVLMNLCVNARDAMPDGGKLTLSISREEVRDEFVVAYPWAKRGHYSVIHVRDTGIGMDSKTIQHIFEPFFTTKGRGKGTGLGLATVYGIVKQHEGMVTVDSVPGSGTEFRLFFPLVKPVESNLATKEHTSEGEISGTVLLVEDDPAVRAITRFMLNKIGVDVIEAENGKMALSLLEQKEDSLILAIIDLVMPDSPGSETAQKIHETFPDLPILFISGYTFHPDDPNSLIIEGKNFLKKPFNQSDLREKIIVLTS